MNKHYEIVGSIPVSKLHPFEGHLTRYSTTIEMLPFTLETV